MIAQYWKPLYSQFLETWKELEINHFYTWKVLENGVELFVQILYVALKRHSLAAWTVWQPCLAIISCGAG